MRKDVKLGLGVGGMLFALVVVYFIALAGNDEVKTAKLKTSGDQANGVVAPGGDSAVDPTVVEATPEPKVVQAKQPEVKPPVVASGRAGGVSSGVAAGTEPPMGGDSVKKVVAPTGSGESVMTVSENGTDQGSGNGTNWELVLSTGGIQGQGQPTDVSSGGTPAAGGTVENNGGVGGGTQGGTQGGTVVNPTVNGPTTTDSDPTALGSGTTVRKHVVVANESYWSIAKAAYGNGGFAEYLGQYNGNKMLRPGMAIDVPDVSALAKMIPAAAAPVAKQQQEEAAIDSSTQYRVGSGDTLWTISVKLYGNSKMVDKLYAVNQQVIGADSSKLKIGEILTLPAAPTARGE